MFSLCKLLQPTAIFTLCFIALLPHTNGQLHFIQNQVSQAIQYMGRNYYLPLLLFVLFVFILYCVLCGIITK